MIVNLYQVPKIILILFVITLGCSGGEPLEEVPENFYQIENLLIYEGDPKPHKKFSFVREITFGENDEVLWGGYISQIEVDNRGRVYITDRFENKIHIYKSDGQFLQSIGRQGEGPGEFQMLWFMHVGQKSLYVLDYIQNKFSTFALDGLYDIEDFYISISDTEEEKPSWINWTQHEGLFYGPTHLYEKPDGNLLVFFGDLNVGAIDNNDIRTLEASSFSLDTGNFSEHDVLSLRADGTALYSDYLVLSDVPYKPRAHIDYNGKNLVYGWSNHLLFKVYNENGRYEHAFYYPFINAEIDVEDFFSMYESMYETVEVEEKNLIRDDISDAWPAFQSLKLDDENRIWVSTIVEDLDVNEWWVLDVSGELIATFEWPSDIPIEVVRNGYIYTREMDEETGVQQVVRYRVENGR